MDRHPVLQDSCTTGQFSGHRFAGLRLLYITPFLSWLLISASLTAAVVTVDLSRSRDRFADRVDRLYRHIIHRVEVNDSVLEGFAALLDSADARDAGEIAGYSRQMLQRHPGKFRFEIAERVNLRDLDDFVHEQRQRGHPAFTVRSFSFESDRRWRPVESRPFYYPVVFTEPLTEVSRAILGLDLWSHRIFRDSLDRSARSRLPTATRPFQLVDGDWAYVMQRPVGEGDSGAGEAGLPPRYAMLVIKAATLLPAIGILPPEMSLILHHRDSVADSPAGQLVVVSAREAVWGGWIPLFPRFSEQRSIDNLAQPFVLAVSQQFGWHNLSWGLLSVIWVASLAWLAVLLNYARARQRAEIRRMEAQNKLFYLANYDALTGLSNRNHLLDRVRHAKYHADRFDKKIGVVFLDLDGFKGINDRYGHAIGDEVLKRVAHRLLGVVRRDDTVARLGGDEFVVVLEDISSEVEATSVAEKLRAAIAEPLRASGIQLLTGASVGVALYPDDSEDFDRLLDLADEAMYRDKKQGPTRGGHGVQEVRIDSQR